MLKVLREHKPSGIPKDYPICCEESYRIGYHIGHEDGCQAQHKDTLRQVVEMLDGIKNPYKTIAQARALYGGLPFMFNPEERVAFNRAIQTMKQALEVEK